MFYKIAVSISLYHCALFSVTLTPDRFERLTWFVLDMLWRYEKIQPKSQSNKQIQLLRSHIHLYRALPIIWLNSVFLNFFYFWLYNEWPHWLGKHGDWKELWGRSSQVRKVFGLYGPQLRKYGDWEGVRGQSIQVRKVFGSYGDLCGSLELVFIRSFIRATPCRILACFFLHFLLLMNGPSNNLKRLCVKIWLIFTKIVFCSSSSVS